MERQSRTFKLRLSPAGMDLLIDSHCHLIRSTRCLLAWGTTLQVAVSCLDMVPANVVIDRLSSLATAGLAGTEEHHLGAPKDLNVTATRIAERVTKTVPGEAAPMLSSIYIAALQQLTRTDCDTLREAYERVRPLSTRI
ncbi:hypothetical protein M2337_002421 [Sphingobium sp. B2D3A]|uniref:hypothetical protein n=1 Tax=unclassified Sphingobium TaxID=2611147 RepID=UPI0022254BB2|nr:MULTISPECIES: hypothetical protein [unclassified Sphingobium]MCW2338188.1 hypothetical protein [Sphingobium sp. B2D3A]MCW2384647.1 hypothetical protein [Sphingobium sp. B2D3D]